MALYQPSNITPSVFAGAGESTVAAADPIRISWQVNGTSAMVSCGVAVYRNDSDSALVHNENSITANCPFYGTDAKGNVTMFTYAPGSTWADWGLTDGGEYKLAITQRYMAGSIPISITQYSPQVFLTRTAPSLTINTFTTPIASITQTFTASYSQAQGDAINSVKWTLTNNTTDAVLEDTGTINTGVLSYTYSGFLPNNNYTITCTVETENGVSAAQSVTFDVEYDEPAASGDVSVSCREDGGILLQWGKPVNIPGTASAVNGYYINTDNKMPLKLLQGYNVTWDTVDGSDMSFEPPYTLAWSGLAPQNAMYGSNVGSNAQNSQLNGEVLCAAINPAGTLAVVGGTFDGYAKLYSISNGRMTYLQDILSSSTAPLDGAVRCADFSQDGQNLVLGGDFTHYAKLYTVSGSSVIYTDDVPSQNGTQHYLDGAVNAAKFTIGSFVGGGVNLIIGGQFTGYAKYYHIESHDTITYLEDFTKSANAPLTSAIRDIAVTYGYCVLCSDYDSGLWGLYADQVIMQELFRQVYGTEYDAVLTADFSDAASSRDAYLALATTDGVGLFEYGIGGWDLIAELTSRDLPNYNPVAVSLQYCDLGSKRYLLVAGQHSTTSAYPYNIQSFIWQYSIDSNGMPGNFVPIYSGNNLDSFTGRINTVRATDGILIAGGAIPEYGQYFSYELRNYTILSLSDGALSINYSPEAGFSVYLSDSLAATISPPSELVHIANVIIRPGSVTVQYYDRTGYMSVREPVSVPLTDALPTITKVQLFGFQQCKYVYITSNTSYAFDTQDPTYDADTIFFARFRDGFQAGTFSTSGVVSSALYRISDSEAILLGIVPTSNTYLIDYGVASRTQYTYQMYYVTDNTFSAAVSSAPVSYQLNGYTLIQARQDDDNPNVYHVLRTWRFAANLNTSSVSNNNSPSFLTNFTPYRIKQPTTQMGRSGTLSALLSIPKDVVYQDTAEQMDELYALSQTSDTLFLKDMKGNVYMITVAGPITQQINDKTQPLEVTVSVPWEEIGDARGLAIIRYQEE